MNSISEAKKRVTLVSEFGGSSVFHYSSGYNVSELRVAAASGRDKHEVDVLLVHGLRGDPIETWGGSLERGADAGARAAFLDKLRNAGTFLGRLVKLRNALDRDPRCAVNTEAVVSDCWVSELAIELHERAKLWTIGYPTALLDRGLGTIPTSIGEDGQAALGALRDAGFGDRPIVFVAHSLGGLLTKAILNKSAEADPGSSDRRIFEQTHRVIFVATPHTGSVHSKWRLLVPSLLSWATRGVGFLAAAVAATFLAKAAIELEMFDLTWRIGAPTIVGLLVVLVLGIWVQKRLAPGRHVLLLDPNEPRLRELKQDFRRIHSRRTFSTVSFYEQKRLCGLFLVVPWWSADPGVTDCEPIPIAADHIGICKYRHAELWRSIREGVDSACLGRTFPVFGKDLERLATESKSNSREEEAFKVLFRSESGDRGDAEQVFRPFLREKIKLEKFIPKPTELDLARNSKFDEDQFAWDLWHEQKLAELLRSLRRKIEPPIKDGDSWPARNTGVDNPPLTLIPFYRTLRTIERVCVGGMSDPGSEKIDRHLLLGLIEDARAKLDQLCSQKGSLDQGGQTRRLLLRMFCLLQVIDTSENYVGSGRMKQRGRELAEALSELRTHFEGALRDFRRTLDSPPRNVP